MSIQRPLSCGKTAEAQTLHMPDQPDHRPLLPHRLWVEDRCMLHATHMCEMSLHSSLSQRHAYVWISPTQDLHSFGYMHHSNLCRRCSCRRCLSSWLILTFTMKLADLNRQISSLQLTPIGNSSGIGTCAANALEWTFCVHSAAAAAARIAQLSHMCSSKECVINCPANTRATD